MARKVGIIGSGPVGQSLAGGFLRHGFEVMIGTHTPAKKGELQTKTGGKAKVGSFEETAKFAELAVLAVKGTAAEAAVRSCGLEHLGGKIVIDATNPIADAPPVNGVLQLFTSPAQSLMERLQNLVPGARFVKAFNCVGNAFMVNPDFGGVKPTMFICGNDTGAKGEVTEVLAKFGWEVEDMGKQESARALEQFVVLWCLPGFLRNEWTHAFKLLKK